MQFEKHVCQLIARKISGEATPDELRELHFLEQEDPELHKFLQTLDSLSQPKEHSHHIEQAYSRHMQRMERKMRAAKMHPQKRNSAEKHSRIYNHAILTSYFKIITRNLYRFKGFSFINIFGLAVGIASAILILLWTQNELSFDQFHEKKDRLYVLYNRATFNGKLECWSAVPTLATPVLQTSYPIVEEVTRVNGIGGIVLHIKDQHLEAKGMMADPGFLKMFSFPVVKGDPAHALSSPRSMVITEDFASKVFPNGDAIGKLIRVDSNAYFKVEAILKHLPNNTSFGFEYLLPYSYMKEVHWYKPSWTADGTRTYALLKPGVTLAAANAAVRNIIKAHAGNVSNEVFLYPFVRWHLHGNFENGIEVGGGIQYVKYFGIVGLFILLIACINYMNLSTARSIAKAKEIGVRKVVGAGNASIVVRFLGESVLLSFLAGVVALVIVRFTIGGFSWLTWKNLSIPYTDAWFWLAFAGFILLTGLIAGSYPAFYLSTYQPIGVLKGSFKTKYSGVSVRKVMVVFQFCFAIVFVICTVGVYRQVNYGSRRDPGYDRDHLAFVYVKGEVNNRYAVIKREMLSSGAVTAVTRSNSPVTYVWSSNDDYTWAGADINKKIFFSEFFVDDDFLETVGIKLVAGRTINTNMYPTDSMAVLLSQSAVAEMGLKNAVGQTIVNGLGRWTVVGVVRDFVPGSPFWSKYPMIIQGPRKGFGAVTFRLNPQNKLAEDMRKIETIFKKYNPEYPFISRFVDEADAEKLEDERRAGIEAGIFGGLAILISCLGLFALSAYMAENRIKEVGVRKVLGATVFNVWGLLSKDFVWLVVIAFVIATPIAWYIMHNWMQDYQYRADLSWWIFAVAGAGALLITLLTVSFQAVRAALANPAASLRSE